MEPSSDPFIALEEKYGPHVYALKKNRFTHGKGALLYTADGKEFIDFVAGHGVGNIGHAHPKVIKAIQEQAEKVLVLHASFPNEERAKLYEKLAQISPKGMSNSFLSNSGTESVEAALKMAIVSHRSIKKPHFIAMKRAFHGRTLGALPLTFGPTYREPFEGFMGNNMSFVSFGDIESVKAAVNENTVGIITEIVQGEGGIYPAPQNFPKELRELCDSKNITLIFDEVQSGFGRTGKMFALEHYNVIPDIICSAKAIAGGVPMGATISREDIFKNFKHSEMASTFGGNPLSCAAANATIDVILQEKLLENAMKLGNLIEKTVNDWMPSIPTIKEQRGLGLMRGIQLKEKVGPYLAESYRRGLLLLNAGMTVIRMLPPLVTTEVQMMKALNILHDVLTTKPTTGSEE